MSVTKEGCLKVAELYCKLRDAWQLDDRDALPWILLQAGAWMHGVRQASQNGTTTIDCRADGSVEVTVRDTDGRLASSVGYLANGKRIKGVE